MKKYLYEWIYCQIIKDRHDDTPSRIISILNDKGWLQLYIINHVL